MIIAISGLTGSGKNTLGELLAEELNYKLVCPTFKDLAKSEGISLMEFQKKAEKDHNIDKKFDKELKSQTKNGDCIVTTWLGPWMVKADIKIYVFAPSEIRSERIAKRDSLSIYEAQKHLKARDEENRKRYQEVYDIDIFDTSSFDLAISSYKYSKDQMLDLALKAIELTQNKNSN